MGTRVAEWFRNLNTKRLVALGIGPGVLALGLDAGIAHFAGREMRHPAQLTPVVFGIAACVALGAAGLPRLTAAHFRALARWVGGAAALVGLVGTGFHLHALWFILAGEPITFSGLTAALAVAPPLFAPAGFAGIGALVWALGNPKLEISFRRTEELPPHRPAQVLRLPAAGKVVAAHAA
jgi:hypothetical protein